MSTFLQIVIGLSILIAGIFMARIGIRMITYYEFQDRYNPSSKRYRQYVRFDPDAPIKYELRIAKVNLLKITKPPISSKALHKMG